MFIDAESLSSWLYAMGDNICYFYQRLQVISGNQCIVLFYQDAYYQVQYLTFYADSIGLLQNHLIILLAITTVQP